MSCCPLKQILSRIFLRFFTPNVSSRRSLSDGLTSQSLEFALYYRACKLWLKRISSTDRLPSDPHWMQENLAIRGLSWRMGSNIQWRSFSYQTFRWVVVLWLMDFFMSWLWKNWTWLIVLKYRLLVGWHGNRTTCLQFISWAWHGHCWVMLFGV